MAHRPPSYCLLALSAIALSQVGCDYTQPLETPTYPPEGTDSSTPSPSPSSPLGAVVDVPGFPAFDATPSVDAFSIPGELRALGGSYSQVYLGSSEGLFRIQGQDVAQVPEPSEAEASLGGVLDIAQWGDEILVLGEGGLFYSLDGAIFPSAIGADASALTMNAIALGDEDTEGDESLWIAAQEGLHLLTTDALFRIEVDGVSGAPTAIAAGGGRLLVSYGDGLVDLTTADLTYRVLDLGAVFDLAIDSQGRGWIAGEEGVWTQGTRGTWTHYLLGDAGEERAAFALTLDLEGAAFVAVEDGVLRLDEGDVEAIAPTSEAVVDLAIDPFGDLWAGGGAAALGIRIGEPLTFESSIAPMFDAQCAHCHLGGVAGPSIDLTQWGEVEPILEDVIERVLTGNMPADGPLSEEEYQLFVMWTESGAQP